MKNTSLSLLFVIGPGHGTVSFFLSLIALFIFITGSLGLFLFFLLDFKKSREAKARKLKKHFELLIEKAIFYEEQTEEEGTKEKAGQWMPVSRKFSASLRKSFSRQVMIDELINTKKNLSGTASENLQKLYEQLGLKKDSLKKLKYSYWYTKARGVLELSEMNQKDCLLKLYKLTNHTNEFVRMEAQSAVINFAGTEGLRFLNIISYPLLPWQQLKLLDQLAGLQAENFPGMEEWLSSDNDSVVLFALRLARIYHRFELHDKVAKCLRHPLPEIRRSAAETLSHIYAENTVALILNSYPNEGKAYRLTALKALGEIGSGEAVPFLTGELGNEDDEIKLAAARALVSSAGSAWPQVLESYPSSSVYPWKEIIQQVKTEKAA